MTTYLASAHFKTQNLSSLSKGLVQARQIQARLRDIAHRAHLLEESPLRKSSAMLAPVWFD